MVALAIVGTLARFSGAEDRYFNHRDPDRRSVSSKTLPSASVPY